MAINKEKIDDNYKYNICTILEPSWAYNNARVLGRIESNWLTNKLAKTEETSDKDSEDGDDEKRRKYIH